MDIEQVSTDKVYDHRYCYDKIVEREAKAVIQPSKYAVIWQHGNRKASPHPRGENLRYIRTHGCKKWKRDSGYHRRSLAKTIMFRLKVIVGSNLSSRKFDNQAVELFIKCTALNRMIRIAKPDSYEVQD